jgi:hypothetical protein
MKRIICLLGLNFYAFLSIGQDVDECEIGKGFAKKDISKNNIGFIKFGFLEDTRTYDKLLEKHNIVSFNTDYLIGEFEGHFVYSCYNKTMGFYIDSVYGKYFLDSLNVLAKEIDASGMGNRIPSPIGISEFKRNLDSLVSKKFKREEYVNEKVVFTFKVSKTGDASNFELISGNEQLYIFLKSTIEGWEWINATRDGEAYDFKSTITYVYSN